jgi:hypothetical protein
MLTFCSCKVQYVVGDPQTQIKTEAKFNTKNDYIFIYLWMFVTIVGLSN